MIAAGARGRSHACCIAGRRPRGCGHSVTRRCRRISDTEKLVGRCRRCRRGVRFIVAGALAGRRLGFFAQAFFVVFLSFYTTASIAKHLDCRFCPDGHVKILTMLSHKAGGAFRWRPPLKRHGTLALAACIGRSLHCQPAIEPIDAAMTMARDPQIRPCTLQAWSLGVTEA